jgi:hypothetical protein
MSAIELVGDSVFGETMGGLQGALESMNSETKIEEGFILKWP